MKQINVKINNMTTTVITLKAEHYDEQDNNYYIMNEVETKELIETKRDDLNGYQNTVTRSI